MDSDPSTNTTQKDEIDERSLANFDEEFRWLDEPIPALENPPLSMFVMKNQLHSTQRRTYKQEIRYFTPNPIQIMKRVAQPGEKLPIVVSGTVTASLADEHGNEIDSYAAELICKHNAFTQALNEYQVAIFSLAARTKKKITLRLLFDVHCVIKDEYGTLRSFRERVKSNSFQLHHGRSKAIVGGLMPKYGRVDQEHTVWIKGMHFRPQLSVTFGMLNVPILSVQRNLIIVNVPRLPNLRETTSVDVKVRNMKDTVSNAVKFTHVVVKSRGVSAS